MYLLDFQPFSPRRMWRKNNFISFPFFLQLFPLFIFLLCVKIIVWNDNGSWQKRVFLQRNSKINCDVSIYCNCFCSFDGKSGKHWKDLLVVLFESQQLLDRAVVRKRWRELWLGYCESFRNFQKIRGNLKTV